MKSLQLLAGVFLGWSLGSNDAANVFGAAVSSQMVRWRTAAALIACFVLAGALLQGGEGIDTYADLADQNMTSALAVCLGAALSVALMSVAQLPVSTSQAVVGGIIGTGLARGEHHFAGLEKVVLCWVGTPVGAALIAAFVYPLAARIVRRANPHFLVYDSVMRTLLILAGVYGAYALGANNVANVTGVFYKAGAFDNSFLPPVFLALLLGGASIGLGALTYSRNVMNTVGSKIVKLDAFSAFVVVLSGAVTVHVYAEVGVPVSTSQAVVGAVLGIGLLKGMRTVRMRTLGGIAVGWLLTPVAGGAAAYGLYAALEPLY